MSMREKVSERISKGHVRKKDFRDSLHSIFVDNINPSVDLSCLWGIFKPFGRVRDIYLSSKICYRRGSFAFIRFETLEEAIEVVKTTNGMFVCGWPISSKVASYGWINRRSGAARYNRRIDAKGVKKIGEVDGKGGSSNHYGSHGFRSYMEAVKAGHKREIKVDENLAFGSEDCRKREEKVLCMSWSRHLNDCGWFSKCTVGVLKEFSSVSSVNDRLSSRGFNFSATYLGDKCVLWSFDSEGDKEGFMNNRFFWDDCFLSMERCSENFSPQARMVWINVSGIPFRCWNSSFLMKLGWLIGEPLLIDEETLHRRRLDRGRLLVLVPKNNQCLCKIKVDEGMGSFVAKVEEDEIPVDYPWLEQILGLKKVTPQSVFSQLSRSSDDLKLQDSDNVNSSALKLDSLGFEAGGLSFNRVRIGSDMQQCRLFQDINECVGEGCGAKKISNKVSEEFEIGRCSARGNGIDGDTLPSLSESEVVRGSFQNFEFQKDRNSVKGGPGGLQNDDGLDLSQTSSFMGHNKTQKFLLLEGLKAGANVRPMGSLGIDPVEYEEGEILSPKEMFGGGNEVSCINGRGGVVLSILPQASAGVIRSSKDPINEAVDGKGPVCSNSKSREFWNMEDEVAKVLEKALALGLNFNGRKKELLDIIAKRDEVNDNRFRDLVRRLVLNYKAKG